MARREANKPGAGEHARQCFPVAGIPSIKEGAPEELIIPVFGVGHRIGGRLASAWSDIKPAVESDAQAIMELSKLIPTSPPLSVESTLSIIRNHRREIGYSQHMLVYKPGGEVKGFTWAELNERSKVAHMRATVCPVLGVGFLLGLSINQVLERKGCERFFTDPNEWSRGNAERLGYHPVIVPSFEKGEKTFYGRNARPRDIYYEFARFSYSNALVLPGPEAQKLMRSWPVKSDTFGTKSVLDVSDDVAECMTRYRMEGHEFRNDVYEELRSGNPVPLLKYLLTSTMVFGGREFGRTENDVTIDASRIPFELRRGTKVLKYGPPRSVL